MTTKEIDAIWDRVAHRYGIDQRDVDWLGLRAGWQQMVVLNSALLKSPVDVIVTPKEMAAALNVYIEFFGAVHDDGCPCDDTCDCGGKVVNDGINAAVRYLGGEWDTK